MIHEFLFPPELRSWICCKWCSCEGDGTCDVEGGQLVGVFEPVLLPPWFGGNDWRRLFRSAGLRL